MPRSSRARSSPGRLRRAVRPARDDDVPVLRAPRRPDDADSLLGELFRIAFEKRAGFDTERAEARPWLYGIASNLLARHRQARRAASTRPLGW